jgi:hypothetical protein
VQDSKSYRLLGDLEQLMDALERRGAREGALYHSLLRHKEAIAKGMPPSPLQCAQQPCHSYAISDHGRPGL